ncbi:MAG TPA: hypothetical protein P5277_01815 [Candidatus Paceibacterota bacterium]|nr:hypothetical protein [Candidatus Paceibacterota bacterium]
MKKLFLGFVFLFLISISATSVFADGMIHVYDKDMWGLFTEEQQFCAINYKDGIQNMILTVDTGEELRGEKAVWIFPVPAKPEKTVINIIKGFPSLNGYDVEEQVDRTISNAFTAMRLTQTYTIPWILFGSFGSIGMGTSNKETLGMQGVTVYESIEKLGLTTELISATNGDSLTNYLTNKGLILETSSKAILEEYIGQEYSFVVSWISDVEKFKQEQGNQTNLYMGMRRGNSIGVFITFPTDRLYFPLKPTSVYGSERVPAVIYVMDYVEPNLYNEIKADSQVNYFFKEYYSPSEELRDFFNNQEIINDLKYTKIKINPPSKYLTQDLWMDISTPAKIQMADTINRYWFYPALVIFLIASCLASLISGLIIFRKDSPSLFKFSLMGFWNLLSFVGFTIASYVMKIDKRFTEAKQNTQEDVGMKKVIGRTLLWGLVIPIIFFTFMFRDMLGHSRLEDILDILLGVLYLIFTIVLFYYGIFCLFISPFVWGYYNNRKVMKFIILFTILFLVLIFLFQHILLAII